MVAPKAVRAVVVVDVALNAVQAVQAVVVVVVVAAAVAVILGGSGRRNAAQKDRLGEEVKLSHAAAVMVTSFFDVAPARVAVLVVPAVVL